MGDDGFSRSDWLRLVSDVTWLVLFVVWPQLTAAVTLLVTGGAFIAFNAMVFWESVVRKEHAPAVAPIFGGVLAAAGVALLPLPGTWQWAWVPLAVDWGGFPLLVVSWYEHRSK